jgi:hypothetical protein
MAHFFDRGEKKHLVVANEKQGATALRASAIAN